MKKENITLLKFLFAMAVATLAGVVAGRLTLPVAQGEIFMPQALFLGPVLAVISLAVLIHSFIKRKTQLLQQLSILAITAFAVVLSGFCGQYSLQDAPVVAATAAVCLLVVAGAVMLEKKWGCSEFHSSAREKISAFAMFVAMFASVNAPLGPVPALVLGCIWLTVTVKKL